MLFLAGFFVAYGVSSQHLISLTAPIAKLTSPSDVQVLSVGTSHVSKQAIAQKVAPNTASNPHPKDTMVLSTTSSEKKGKTPVPSGFVSTSGENFMLSGHVFRSIGMNRYNLLTQGGSPYVGCGGTFSKTALPTWFSELKDMGVTSVRFWLFQSFTKNGTDFSRFDYVLNLAEQNGIKVIPVFENQWKDCTDGGYKDTAWYQDGYKHPYGAYQLSYRDYVARVVGHYKK